MKNGADIHAFLLTSLEMDNAYIYSIEDKQCANHSIILQIWLIPGPFMNFIIIVTMYKGN
jgi:hypothetical protein